MKRIISIALILLLVFAIPTNIYAESGIKNEAESFGSIYKADVSLKNKYKSVYLCEASTGKVLYADKEYEASSPASVTKVMTLLLVCEALDQGRIALNEMVTISANAASMGGSQVFLEEGERISVEELIKAAVIASGNDASVALAELCAGSEAAFVNQMNQRAKELGLKNTHFENPTGLDDTTTEHYSCSADIAKMSRELISHEIILKYSSIWQDTIRNGEFTLTNTNRLVRYYDGCNGLKTGSTDKAGYCVSATAKRGNMQLIAVVMGAESRDDRNQIARELLDFGFANYALFERGEEYIEEADVLGGKSDFVQLFSSPYSCVVEKSMLKKVEMIYDIPRDLHAPIKSGQSIGRVIYKVGEDQIGFSEIYSKDDVESIKIGDLFGRIFMRIICGKIS